MKIAMVTDYHNKTGIGKQNYQLFRALRKLWHDVEIINLVSPQGFSAVPEYGTNIVSKYFLKGVFFDFRKGLAACLQKVRYDAVLLGHQWLAYLHSTLEKSERPFAIVVDDLFTFYPEYAPWWDVRFWVFNKFLLNRVSRFENVVFISEFSARDFLRIFSVAPKRSAVIPIGTDVCGIRESGGRDWSDFFARKTVVLQVGSFDVRKNAETFFEIARFATCAPDFENVMFVRVGKTPKLKKETAPKNMVFLRNLSEADLASLYSYASIFVFTSLHEGYGMPIVEARSVGLPVVSTDIADMSKLFAEDQGITFVSNPKNASEYVGAIREFFRRGERTVPSPATPSLSTESEAKAYVDFLSDLANRKPLSRFRR